MKKVGILGVHKNDSILGKTNRLNFGCTEFVENTGKSIPFIIPSNTKKIDYYIDFFESFIIPGGNDIDPSFYGENHAGSVDTIKEHDEFLLTFLQKAIASGKPILGICKGMQIINVFFGGSLEQDIENHMKVEEKDRGIHHISIIKNSFLSGIFEKNILEVNSLHHQCIKTLGNDLEVVAVSQEDNIIEAIQHKNKPIYGLQWHPEYLKEHQKIFDWFINL